MSGFANLHVTNGQGNKPEREKANKNGACSVKDVNFRRRFRAAEVVTFSALLLAPAKCTQPHSLLAVLSVLNFSHQESRYKTGADSSRSGDPCGEHLPVR